MLKDAFIVRDNRFKSKFIFTRTIQNFTVKLLFQVVSQCKRQTDILTVSLSILPRGGYVNLKKNKYREGFKCHVARYTLFHFTSGFQDIYIYIYIKGRR